MFVVGFWRSGSYTLVLRADSAQRITPSRAQEAICSALATVLSLQSFVFLTEAILLYSIISDAGVTTFF